MIKITDHPESTEKSTPAELKQFQKAAEKIHSRLPEDLKEPIYDGKSWEI